jgi:hypothetical protein
LHTIPGGQRGGTQLGHPPSRVAWVEVKVEVEIETVAAKIVAKIHRRRAFIRVSSFLLLYFLNFCQIGEPVKTVVAKDDGPGTRRF